MKRIGAGQFTHRGPVRHSQFVRRGLCLAGLMAITTACAGRDVTEAERPLPPRLADEMTACEQTIRRGSGPMGFSCVLFNVGIDGRSGPTWIEPKWWTDLPALPQRRRVSVRPVRDQRSNTDPYRYGRASVVGRGGTWLAEDEPVAVMLGRAGGLALYGRGAVVVESWREGGRQTPDADVSLILEIARFWTTKTLTLAGPWMNATPCNDQVEITLTVVKGPSDALIWTKKFVPNTTSASPTCGLLGEFVVRVVRPVATDSEFTAALVDSQ